MDPAIKKVAILLAAALIVVIGLIILTNGTEAKKVEVATVGTENQTVETAQQTEETKKPTAQEPNQEAQASQKDVTQEAHIEEEAQTTEMYEGALAGLSEEEIAKMALAEEQSAARSETDDGAEGAVD